MDLRHQSSAMLGVGISCSRTIALRAQGSGFVGGFADAGRNQQDKKYAQDC